MESRDYQAALQITAAIKELTRLYLDLKDSLAPAAWAGTIFGRPDQNRPGLPLTSQPWFRRMVTYLYSATPEDDLSIVRDRASDLLRELFFVEDGYKAWLVAYEAYRHPPHWGGRVPYVTYASMLDPEQDTAQLNAKKIYLKRLQDLLDWYRAYPFTQPDEAAAMLWYTSLPKP
jgi:hypothetical protein